MLSTYYVPHTVLGTENRKNQMTKDAMWRERSPEKQWLMPWWQPAQGMEEQKEFKEGSQKLWEFSLEDSEWKKKPQTFGTTLGCDNSIAVT